jgi:hypothetical protein
MSAPTQRGAVDVTTSVLAKELGLRNPVETESSHENVTLAWAQRSTK